MNAKRWEDLCKRLERVVFRRGVQAVADEIPAARRTVYRLLHGETKRPTRALLAGVERVVSEEREK
jgi:hypothetical protein